MKKKFIIYYNEMLLEYKIDLNNLFDYKIINLINKVLEYHHENIN